MIAYANESLEFRDGEREIRPAPRKPERLFIRRSVKKPGQVKTKNTH